MEYQKIISVLDATSSNVPKFSTKKWIEVYDQSGGINNTNNQIRFKKSILRSDLCDCSDGYIVVKETVNVTVRNDNAYNNKLALKNNAPFINCILKINDTLTDNAENLHIVMLMFKLIRYSKNYSKITGSLWNYYRDQPNSGAV